MIASYSKAPCLQCRARRGPAALPVVSGQQSGDHRFPRVGFSERRGNCPQDRCHLPTPVRYAPSDGEWQMQDYPGAPGSARPGNPGTAVPAACGGAAGQPLPKAPDHHRSSAAPMPKAPGHIRPGAASMPMAPGHNRPRAASMASPGHADAGCGPASAGRRVPLTTAPVPAHASRLLQVVLLRVAATPRTRTDPLSHATTHQVHPAIQVPTRPPPATAGTGVPLAPHSRAPPVAARRKPILLRGPKGGRCLPHPALSA